MSVTRAKWGKGIKGNQEKPPEVQLLFHTVNEKGQQHYEKAQGE